ncbi:MAG: B12-binding domain-containing radical SAM protein [Saprospiraceae bacterium]|nr:B12-binding domain-containing radical SAM protein [Saprospiraceae bacterium]
MKPPMYKILFIQATQYSSGSKTLVKQKRLYLPGLAFPLMAAMTPTNWEVDICLEVIEDVNFDAECDIVGIGAMGQAVIRAIEIAKEFKRRGKTVIMGGYMPSMVPDFVKKVCDSIVIGDSEIAYPQLLKDYENGQLKQIYHSPVKDIKGLPVPKYELLLNKKIGFMLPVQAGRGCPHACSYCSIYCLYRKRYLTRPLDEVIRDIIRVKELGFKAFYLLDDNIMSNPKFLKALCDKIKPLNMVWASQCSILLAKNPQLLKLAAESGCRILSLGVESISQEGLDKLNKKWVKVQEHEELLRRIVDAGILPATEMIVGTDGDTMDSLKQTYDFVMKTNIPIPKFYIMTPMPGSDLYSEYKAQGRLLHEDYSRYTATNTVFKPQKLTAEELDKMYWWLYKRVYSLPNILKRTILHKNFFKSPLSYLFALVVNLNYMLFIRRGDAPNVF